METLSSAAGGPFPAREQTGILSRSVESLGDGKEMGLGIGGKAVEEAAGCGALKGRVRGYTAEHVAHRSGVLDSHSEVCDG